MRARVFTALLSSLFVIACGDGNNEAAQANLSEIQSAISKAEQMSSHFDKKGAINEVSSQVYWLIKNYPDSDIATQLEEGKEVDGVSKGWAKKQLSAVENAIVSEFVTSVFGNENMSDKTLVRSYYEPAVKAVAYSSIYSIWDPSISPRSPVKRSFDRCFGQMKGQNSMSRSEIKLFVASSVYFMNERSFDKTYKKFPNSAQFQRMKNNAVAYFSKEYQFADSSSGETNHRYEKLKGKVGAVYSCMLGR